MGPLMIKAAFAAWGNRIAPVFDVARQIHLVEARSGQIVRETQELLADDLPVQKAIRLAELDVGTLVCGAISRPLHGIIAAYGIQVIPFLAGDLREVIQAWIAGELDSDVFAMPGCCGRDRGRFRGMHNLYRKEYFMNGKRRGRKGLRGGKGVGGQGLGRMGGPLTGGPDGYCVCTKCGHQEPHERGIPCTQKKCPQCGGALSRQ